MLNDSRGFTLTELVIALAIITILSSIGVKQLAYYRQSAYNAAATADLMNVKLHLNAYYMENARYPE